MRDDSAGERAHRWFGGLHRTDGLSASTRRYAVIVGILVAMASLPTLVAIRAGSASLDRAAGDGGTTPFIAQPSTVPVVIVPYPPATFLPPAQPEPRQLRGAARPGAA
ncbi:MAG TPA: hypothetical protein VES42_04635, partial [Pilimelia sp.]|nr:hypothetical protein [Pilimelia sp.]